MLKTSEEAVMEALDHVGIPAFVKNSSGIYISCTHQFADVIGVADRKIIGGTVFDIQPIVLSEKTVEVDKILLQNGGVLKYNTNLLNADGRELAVSVSKYRAADGVNGDPYLVGTLKVLTGQNNDFDNFKIDKKDEMLTQAELNFILSEVSQIQASNRQSSCLDQLSNRELQVLHCICHGHSSKEIGHDLAISVHTVNDYIKIMYRKLKVNSRAKLILLAHEVGLI